MTNQLDAKRLSAKLKNKSTTELSQQFALLIRNGDIPVGTTLPRVKDLAQVLNVSIGTISNVWASLREQQMIETTKQDGAIVTNQFNYKLATRVTDFNKYNNDIIFDLTHSKSDPKLLPDLKPAFVHALASPGLNSHEPIAITDNLLHAVKQSWPYDASDFLTTSHLFEAFYLLLKNIISPGCCVAIETPTLLSLLEILRSLNVKVVPVECDNFGPVPEKLAAALKFKPVAFIYQPRAQLPCGHTVNKKRLKELARVLRWQEKTFIIETDMMGDISSSASVTMAEYYPQNTIYIRSYLETYGFDISLAVLSTNNHNLKQCIFNMQSLCTNGTSRILQEALAWAIMDHKIQLQVKKARREYHKRLYALIDALGARGITLEDKDGMSLLLPVESERIAVMALAQQGLLILGGSYLKVDKSEQDYIRVSTSMLPVSHSGWVADALANIINFNRYQTH